MSVPGSTENLREFFIVRPYEQESALPHYFTTNHGIRRNLLQMLGASDLAALCRAFACELSDVEQQKYLHLLRDIPEHEDWTKAKVSEGAAVVAVGADLDLIVQRIRDPDHILANAHPDLVDGCDEA